jgi:hypothetical protein
VVRLIRQQLKRWKEAKEEATRIVKTAAG